MNSQSVKACPGSRIRGCSRAAAAMSATWCCRAWCSASAALAARPCAHPHDRYRQGEGRAGRAGGAHRRRLAGLGMGRPAGAGRAEAPRRQRFKPPYPALVKDQVRLVGDYVAFVVAESLHQAMDAAELIEVDYEPLPAWSRPRKRAPRRGEGLGRMRRQYRLRAAVRRQGRGQQARQRFWDRRRADAGRRCRAVVGTHLLVATGRRPNTDDLGLDAGGRARPTSAATSPLTIS